MLLVDLLSLTRGHVKGIYLSFLSIITILFLFECVHTWLYSLQYAISNLHLCRSLLLVNMVFITLVALITMLFDLLFYWKYSWMNITTIHFVVASWDSIEKCVMFRKRISLLELFFCKELVKLPWLLMCLMTFFVLKVHSNKDIK